jgi:hypothetical protein
MPRIVVFAIAFLINAATVCEAETHRIAVKFPNSLPLAFAGQQRAKAASSLSRPRRTAVPTAFIFTRL